MKKAIFEMGESSVKLPMPVYIVNGASIAGTKEGQGPLGSCIDHVLTDDQFGADSWEAAECKLQKETVAILLKKTEVSEKEIRYLFAGDLLGQSMASSFGLASYEIPYFGVYGACSTCGESLSLGAMTIGGRVCYAGCLCDIQSFRKCGKGVPFPFGIWRTETEIFYLDGNGKRGFPAGNRGE